jgi:hypothetical protein
VNEKMDDERRREHGYEHRREGRRHHGREQGATVVLKARRTERIQSLADELTRKGLRASSSPTLSASRGHREMDDVLTYQATFEAG